MKKKILCSLIALVTVVALVACGQKPSGGGSGSENPSGGESTGREATNSVVVGITQDIDSLDPHNAEAAGTREVLFNMFEGLVKATPEGEIEPAVASDYVVSEDATNITFTLRDGISFCDGTPVTAEDVKYSIERYAGIQGEGSAFSILKEIVIEADGKTIQVNLSEPNTEFVYELTCAVIPQANEANVNSNPIGTGPFMFDEFIPGEKLVVKKNPNYWKAGFPYLDEVTFRIVSDTDVAVTQLNAGTLDIVQYLTADQAMTLNDNFYIEDGSINYVQALFLNNAVAPFDNPLVRQAIYYAVDRQKISNMLFGGKSHIIGTNMIPAATKYYNADTENQYPYDPAKAKELLKQAGYENGFTFTIQVPNNYPPHRGTAEIISNCLEEIGVTAKLNEIEFTSWRNDVYHGRQFEATVVAVDGRLAPYTWFAKNESTASNNFTNYSNPQFDEIYAKARAAIDPEEKVGYYKQLQQILADDAASIYIQDPANQVAIRKSLTGYVFYPVSAQDMSVVKYK